MNGSRWPTATETRSLQVLPGHVLAAQGFPIPDRDGTYRFTVQLAMIWPYDEHARLIGDVYVDVSSIRIEPGDPADIVTTNAWRNWSRRCSSSRGERWRRPGRRAVRGARRWRRTRRSGTG